MSLRTRHTFGQKNNLGPISYLFVVAKTAFFDGRFLKHLMRFLGIEYRDFDKKFDCLVIVYAGIII